MNCQEFMTMRLKEKKYDLSMSENNSTLKVLRLPSFMTRELQNARIIASFAGHDLRGELGRSLSFLQLMEQGVIPKEDLAETLGIIKKSVEDGLNSLDEKLAKHGVDLKHLWVFSDNPRVKEIDGLVLKGQILCRSIDIHYDVKALRKEFRPDFVVIDIEKGRC
jgi:hypothetical protein